ncbi:NADH-ubiquinone oxidoreductase B18 subunit-domain-containing protein [Lentinula raphanica]|nr:NADH-ubiquinone oxidoreductase B18 subunit-domain-containing protein [Lentinula raphanica]
MTSSTPTTTASREEMKAAKLPLGWRDQCSALLIPLNICRRDKNFLPWECEHERHAYEKCQYDDYMRRMSELSRRKREELEA